MTIHSIPNRAVLRLDGADTLALLERTVTHTVTDWSVDEMRYGALLTPQGKIIADYIALRTETGVLIDCHEEALGDLEKRLKMFRLRSDVVIERMEGWGVLADDANGTPDPRLNKGATARLPNRKVAPLKSAVVMTDWNRKRIAAGIPEWGYDYRAAEVFPTDINMDLMNGIDYKKGCFVGQEVASRMMRRGKIRKRSVIVQGPNLEKGSDLFGETIFGVISSTAEPNIGLAVIRLDRFQKALKSGSPILCNKGSTDVFRHPWLQDELSALGND